MTQPHRRKVKIIEFSIGAESFEIQVQNWRMNNNTPDGDRFYTQAPGGEFREDPEPDYSLDLTFFADWRADGISDFLTAHDGERMAFQLDHLPDIVGEHVRWAGFLTVKAPTAGADARTTETSDITLQIEGKPTYSRP